VMMVVMMLVIVLLERCYSPLNYHKDDDAHDDAKLLFSYFISFH
jgi:hypothetical protein